MAEKFAGKGILGGLMKNVLSVAPSSVLTEEDVQQMWEDVNHTHNYTSSITTEPTCEVPGVKTFSCECGHSYTEEIDPLGHDFGEFVTDVEATCDTAGSKSQHCSRCGAKQNVTEIPAWGHDYEEPVYTWSDDMLTCTASRTCVTDGHVDTETVNTVSEVTTEATCESTGVRTYTAEFTNEAFAKQLKNETIDALGHTYESVVTDPTCEEAGFTTHTCTRCGHSYTDTEVDALGHEYTSEITREATCTENGIMTYTCSRCGNSYTDEILATGHTFVDGICTVCGAEDPDYVPPIEVAPDGELSNWSYTLDETNKIVTLNQYAGSATDVTVYGRYQLNGVEYDTKIGNSNINFNSANYMFGEKSSIKTITFKEGIDTSDVTNMMRMFDGCSSLTTINGLENFDTSNVTYMYSMFKGCSSLTTLDLTSFDTSNVTYMTSMFQGCSSLTTLDLTSFDTSNVTKMTFMFDGCSSLTTINGLENFDTSNVTDMSIMFQSCTALTTLDLTSFDTSNVTTMSSMFYRCTALTTLDLTSFDTSNVTNMFHMFTNCSVLTEIKVTTGKWVIADGCTTTDMFYNCGVSDVTYVDAA